jgi:tetratricopeptide (TPR) repeat protein
MFFKKSSNIFLSPVVNVPVALFLLSAFFIAGQNVVQTFAVADMAALNNLRPQPADYFWELNTHREAPDKNKIRCYADYYEHMLEVFPNLWDAYGMLGYCYHYLNDDPRAIRFLKIAVKNHPDYFWNYYNLAAIYINGSRYQEASGLLKKALSLPAVSSLKSMFASRFVYLPLLEPDEKKALEDTANHLYEAYRSSFVLVQIFDQAADSKEALEVMKKIKLELYAF